MANLGGLMPATAVVIASDASSRVKQWAWAARSHLGDLVQICVGTSDNVQIQAAIDALPIVNDWRSGHIIFSEGTFDIRAKLDPNSTYAAIVFSGQGRTSTRLIWNTGVSGDFVFDLYAGSAEGRRIDLYDMAINGGGSGSETGKALWLGRADAAGSAEYKLYNVRVSYCASPAIDMDYVSMATFSEVSADNNLGWDVDMDSGSHLMIFGGLYQKVSVNEGWFHTYGATHHHIDIEQNVSYGAIKIDGSFFDPVPTGYESHIILGSSGNVKAPIIFGNNFGTAPEANKYFIDIVNTNNTRIFANDYTASVPPTTYINIQANATDTLIDEGSNISESLITDAGTRTRIFYRNEPDPQYKIPVNLLNNGGFEVGDPPVAWSALRSTFTRETTEIKFGASAAKIVAACTSANSMFRQFVPNYERYKGRKVTLGAWVRAEAANDKAQAMTLYDGVGETASSTFTKDGAYHWVTLTRKISATANQLEVTFYVVKTAATDSDDILYVSGAMLVEGDSCPAFSPKPDDNLASHHTSAYTMSRYESGHVVHTNYGASGAVVITLPQTVSTGYPCRFAVMAAKELRVDPGAAGAIYINGAKQADNAYISSSHIGDEITLVSDGNGDWVVSSQAGNWSVESVGIASGSIVSISKTIDHASLTDVGDATAYMDFGDAIPAGSIIKSVKCDFTEAFNSDDTSTLTMMIGLQADLDAFNKTVDPGEDAFNHTTDVFWGESDCQEPVVTSAATPRVTFTEDDDGTDIINSANAQGAVTVTITYMKA
uniref:Uncharacterized protein n=1 Tax=viral metagenome TaxID=1070528 RepID=A0A6M3KVJ9_9ZZZZ